MSIRGEEKGGNCYKFNSSCIGFGHLNCLNIYATLIIAPSLPLSGNGFPRVNLGFHPIEILAIVWLSRLLYSVRVIGLVGASCLCVVRDRLGIGVLPWSPAISKGWILGRCLINGVGYPGVPAGFDLGAGELRH